MPRFTRQSHSLSLFAASLSVLLCFQTGTAHLRMNQPVPGVVGNPSLTDCGSVVRQPPEALHGAGTSPARKTRASMQRSWELCALDIKTLDQAVFDSKHVTDHLIR